MCEAGVVNETLQSRCRLQSCHPNHHAGSLPNAVRPNFGIRRLCQSYGILLPNFFLLVPYIILLAFL